MRTATHLQLFRFKCVAFVQQKYHNSISSSRGFCRFFERKCKKIKISRSENVSQAQQIHPRSREFVTSVLRFTVFRIVSSHLTCCILFFYTFSAMFFMHFSVCLFAYMHISKCNRLLCALFHSTPLPSRSPFLGCSQPLAVLSATKNSTGSLFRAICAVPYSLYKKKSGSEEPPFHNSGYAIEKILLQAITEQPLLPRSA